MSRPHLETIAAPYGREVRLADLPFESGMRLLRVTIREGRRFTVLDMDADSAARLGRAMIRWCDQQDDCGKPEDTA